ncbi:hypothetical protein FB567DRAFT_553416 [Paraphoma chrysanthemicola]|uniref:Uncharacterized protein n=1 Tax=Paraphoma chrysanthemicola TaxID=798071 RepID=A0A8K0QYB7_9PLEO|nr:hypothetical protein FB567DRAFT_553416 [Paraphoma chrysanthemicola]
MDLALLASLMSFFRWHLAYRDQEAAADISYVSQSSIKPSPDLTPKADHHGRAGEPRQGADQLGSELCATQSITCERSTPSAGNTVTSSFSILRSGAPGLIVGSTHAKWHASLPQGAAGGLRRCPDHRGEHPSTMTDSWSNALLGDLAGLCTDKTDNIEIVTNLIIPRLPRAPKGAL